MNWFFNPQSFLIRNSMQMHSKLVFGILLKEFFGWTGISRKLNDDSMLWKQVVNWSCTFIRVENLSIWAFVLTTLEPVNQKLDHPFLEIIEVSNSTSLNKFFLKWANWPNWWLDFQTLTVKKSFVSLNLRFWGLFRLVIF